MPRVKPVDGCGLTETVDDKLAPSFNVIITEAGVKFAEEVIGWRGNVIDGKYEGATIQLTPRTLDWVGIVVAKVVRDETTLFSGIAETVGLRMSWK